MSAIFQGNNTLQFTPDNKFCYAYNYYATTATARSVLTFQTNSEYIVGTIQLNAGVDDDDPSQATVQSTALIQFNNNNISLLAASSGATPDRRPSSNTQELIIPPFTTVNIIVDDYNDVADTFGSIGFTGKVGMAPRVGN
jgi:hypothetical protein